MRRGEVIVLVVMAIFGFPMIVMFAFFLLVCVVMELIWRLYEKANN